MKRSSASWQVRFIDSLFPSVPRDFPLRRSLRIGLRTAHILATGVLLGGHVFDVSITALEPWLWFSVISGLLLFATDLHASLICLAQVHGVMVILKTALLAMLPLFWEHRIALLVIILVIGGISSHMPGRFRHQLVFFPARLAPYQRPR